MNKCIKRFGDYGVSVCVFHLHTFSCGFIMLSLWDDGDGGVAATVACVLGLVLVVDGGGGGVVQKKKK